MMPWLVIANGCPWEKSGHDIHNISDRSVCLMKDDGKCRRGSWEGQLFLSQQKLGCIMW